MEYKDFLIGTCAVWRVKINKPKCENHIGMLIEVMIH